MPILIGFGIALIAFPLYIIVVYLLTKGAR